MQGHRRLSRSALSVHQLDIDNELFTLCWMEIMNDLEGYKIKSNKLEMFFTEIKM